MPNPTILGAIAGDIIGSVFEFNNYSKQGLDGFFSRHCTFTDDTVLTIAIADCILNNKDYASTIWEYGNKYPYRGYGGRFAEWLKSSDKLPYNSFGNGSAMRVSPVGFAYNDLTTVLDIAARTAEVTHNHPEGIKGAQAIAAAIFLARQGQSKEQIKSYIEQTFQYDLSFTLDEIKTTYTFDETCQGSVPQAIVAFLESTSYGNAIYKAIELGGDSDTIACMTGGIAVAFYKEMPDKFIQFSYDNLPDEFIEIINEFDRRFAQEL